MSEAVDYRFDRKIIVGHSKIHGRGVFATKDIKAGELVERCPMIIMAHRMNYHKDPAIWSYMFTNTCPCEECKKHGGHFLMVMGYGQIYNHQNDNNAHITFFLKEQYADVNALKDISEGEEVFVSYGPNYFKDREYVQANSYPALDDPSATSN